MARAMNIDKRLGALKAISARAKAHAAKAERIAAEVRGSSSAGGPCARRVADKAEELSQALDHVAAIRI